MKCGLEHSQTYFPQVVVGGIDIIIKVISATMDVTLLLRTE